MTKDHSMHYRTLGNSGAVVSTYALGTMTFGAEADEATSHGGISDYPYGKAAVDQRHRAVDVSG